MKTITKKELVKNIPDRWGYQYPQKSGDKHEIYLKLKAETNLTEDRAEEIIGNRSWARNICDECQKDCEITVQLGAEPDYESSTANICVECLKAALKRTEGK